MADDLVAKGQALTLPGIARIVMHESRQENLFLGNSSAIRAFETWYFGDLDSRFRRVEANRGASGIEGLLSTTLGLALETGDAWDLVIGDVSLIHDINALFQLHQMQLPVRVLLVNNFGGQIFRNLPIGQFQDTLDPLISTPHQYSFGGVAGSVGIYYSEVRTLETLREVVATPCTCPELIEIILDPEDDSKMMESLKSLRLETCL